MTDLFFVIPFVLRCLIECSWIYQRLPSLSVLILRFYKCFPTVFEQLIRDILNSGSLPAFYYSVSPLCRITTFFVSAWCVTDIDWLGATPVKCLVHGFSVILLVVWTSFTFYFCLEPSSIFSSIIPWQLCTISCIPSLMVGFLLLSVLLHRRTMGYSYLSRILVFLAASVIFAFNFFHAFSTLSSGNLFPVNFSAVFISLCLTFMWAYNSFSCGETC